jgi:hypothetical protein
MFLGGSSGYNQRDGSQWSRGPFLALFSKTAGGEIRACVRHARMHQLGHFMVGDLIIKSDRAKAIHDTGPSPTHPHPEHYKPYILDGAYRVYIEGTYGDNGLTIDVEKYVGLWEILHPLPVELTWMKWKDKQGWNSAGSEGPSIRQWAIDNIKMLRRPFMEDSTENLRRSMAKEINENPGTREELEATHGKGNVWDTEELKRDFDVQGFAAPFVIVTRKKDGVSGTLLFQHHPRFYWGFQAR